MGKWMKRITEVLPEKQVMTATVIVSMLHFWEYMQEKNKHEFASVLKLANEYKVTVYPRGKRVWRRPFSRSTDGGRTSTKTIYKIRTKLNKPKESIETSSAYHHITYFPAIC